MVSNIEDLQAKEAELNKMKTQAIYETDYPTSSKAEDGKFITSKGAKESVKIRVLADFKNFTGVEIDGKMLDSKDYTAVEGSIIVTLNQSFTDGLSLGDHTIRILTDRGYAQGVITSQKATEIKSSETATAKAETTTAEAGKVTQAKKDSSANTGDEGTPFMMMIMMLAFVAMGGTAVMKKEKK